MNSLWQDVRFGLRLFEKSPGATLVAIVALALGIGANATVFTIANGFLLRNLPFAGSSRIVYIAATRGDEDEGRGVSYPDFLDYQREATSFETEPASPARANSLGAFSRFDVDLSDNVSLPNQYKGARMSPNAFALIGQRPVLGRDFTAEDALPSSPKVAILAFGLWKSRYDGDPSVIGSTIRVNEEPTIVIGVMGPGLRFPGDSSLWIPLTPEGNWRRRSYRALTMFGRLAPHATIDSARAELTTLARNLERRYPETDKGLEVRLESFNDFFVGQDTRSTLFALAGAVGFVLLIACGNVANLLLARAVLRERELSVRAALGAGRGRLVRQLLVESLLLSLAGGTAGTVLGIWGVRLFRGASLGRRGRRLSTTLVTAELALAFVLLSGAGLMIRSFVKMAMTPVGANTGHLMSMDVLLRPAKYPTLASQISFYAELQARVASLPGVVSVGMASNLPGDGWTDFYYEPEGRSPIDPRRRPQTGGVVISPSYFSLLDVGAIRGRVFTGDDGRNGAHVLVVNRSFAQRCWPGQDAIGKRLRVVEREAGAPPGAAQPWFTVVGVVPDIVQNDVSQGLHDPLVYLPYIELPQREMVIGARTVVPPESLANDFRRALQALDPDMPVTDLRTLDQLLWERTWKWRIYGGMFSLFAALALLLAAVGLYSVLAHSINQRVPEIGVRIALGASRRDILQLAFAAGLKQIAAGLLLGLLASLLTMRLLAAMLVGVQPSDPLTLLTVSGVLLLAGLLGIAIPARRALDIDPAVALRHE